MAKKNTGPSASTKKAPKPRPKSQPAVGGGSVKAAKNALDQNAQSYARLMFDPCNAPLVHPVYPGGDSGFLFRAESFATFANEATSTSGYVHWAPGYVNGSSTELLVNASTAGNVATANTALGSAGPGKAFLSANAKGVRCVAACIKVTYPGAESTRAGRLHYGLTNAGMIDVANSIAPDSVAQTLQHYTRTPPETVELVWKPNVADTEFNDPSEVANAQIRDRKASLTVAWAGIPVATGMTFHFTAIYEWTPATGLGVGHNSLGKNLSRNSLDDVVDFLVRTGFSFVRQGAAHGAATLVNSIATHYGLMSAGPRARMTGF